MVNAYDVDPGQGRSRGHGRVTAIEGIESVLIAALPSIFPIPATPVRGRLQAFTRHHRLNE